MKISGFFYKNIFVENMDIKLKNNKIITPFLEIKIDDFSVNNIKLKPNIAYDENLKKYKLEKILEKNNEKFYFYKIESILIKKLTFDSKLKNLDKAIQEFEKISSSNPIYTIVFNELYTNALEHGNFDIDFFKKQEEIKKNTYEQLLKNLEKKFKNKKIYLEIRKYKNYLIIKIKSEGKHFDIRKLNINPKFSGRGIKIAIKYSKKLFYSLNDNSVIFIIQE